MISYSSASSFSYRLYKEILREEYKSSKVTARDLVNQEANDLMMTRIANLLPYFVISDGEDSVETGQTVLVLWALQPQFFIHWLKENPKAAKKICTELEGILHYLSSSTLTKSEYERVLVGISGSLSTLPAIIEESGDLAFSLKEISNVISLELEK